MFEGLRSKCASKNLPSEQALSDQAEHNVGSFAIEIIFPGADFFVLQYHIESEAAKEDEDRDEYPVDEAWCRTTIVGPEPHGEGDQRPRDYSSQTTNPIADPASF